MFEAKNIEQHYSLEERLFLEKVRGFCQLVEDRYSPYLTAVSYTHLTLPTTSRV